MTTIKPLPVSRAPVPGENFASFIARNAAIFGCTANDLIKHCLNGAGCAPFGPDVQLDCSDAVISQLATRFTLKKKDITALFVQSHWPFLERRDLTATSGVNDDDNGETLLSQQLRFGWCPQCLLEDRAGGQDHFLRHEWAFSAVTMCSQHGRPLNGRCTACFSWIEVPECAVYGKKIAFVCPTCGAPLDGQLGIDAVASQHARKMLKCPQTEALWRRIVDYETFLLRALRIKQGNAKRPKMAHIITTLANLLLHAANGSPVRPIDCFANHIFNAPSKMGWPTRHLSEPFAAAHLIERRKALVVIIATLEDSFAQFGFSPHYAFAHHCRDTMTPENYIKFERSLFDLARLALPISL